jgi:hypothetical protein
MVELWFGAHDRHGGGVVLKRLVRRTLLAAGYRVTRVPKPQPLSPEVLKGPLVAGPGTHFIPLAAAVARTLGEGPVLELGMGDFSTPLLHLLCQGRRLVSADSSAEWMARYEGLRSSNHELHLVQDWSRFRLVEEASWAVAFVDCAPAHARVELIERLRGRAIYVVVHDTETDTEAAGVYGCERALDSYRFRSDYRLFRPYTTIVSDDRPFLLSEAESRAPAARP